MSYFLTFIAGALGAIAFIMLGSEKPLAGITYALVMMFTLGYAWLLNKFDKKFGQPTKREAP